MKLSHVFISAVIAGIAAGLLNSYAGIVLPNQGA